MKTRITKIYCLDCELPFSKKMPIDHNSLVHNSRDNKITDGETIVTCVYCNGTRLCLNEYKNKLKKT